MRIQSPLSLSKHLLDHTPCTLNAANAMRNTNRTAVGRTVVGVDNSNTIGEVVAADLTTVRLVECLTVGVVVQLIAALYVNRCNIPEHTIIACALDFVSSNSSLA